MIERQVFLILDFASNTVRRARAYIDITTDFAELLIYLKRNITERTINTRCPLHLRMYGGLCS